MPDPENLNATCARCGGFIFPGEQHVPIPDGTYTSGQFAGCTFENVCAVKLKEDSDA
jgi:hypothetical protein